MMRASLAGTRGRVNEWLARNPAIPGGTRGSPARSLALCAAGAGFDGARTFFPMPGLIHREFAGRDRPAMRVLETRKSHPAMVLSSNPILVSRSEAERSFAPASDALRLIAVESPISQPSPESESIRSGEASFPSRRT